MGQGPSSSEGMLVGKLQAHVEVFKKIATLSYEDFLQSVKDLNEITQSFTDRRGKQLQFRIQPGTDDTVFWRASVRIECSKVNSRQKHVESTRLLNLRQYVVMYKEISDQVANLSNVSRTTGNPSESFTASVILDNLMESDAGIVEDECCICMDRHAGLVLACNHRFCEHCIDSWNVSHQTCPLCRTRVRNDDTWVLTERPDTTDFATDVNSYLVGLADRKKQDAT